MKPAAPVTNSLIEGPSSQTAAGDGETPAREQRYSFPFVTDNADLDWFGEPLPPSREGARLAVPCPFCSELFQEGPALAGHLDAAHDFRVSRRTSPLDRLPPWLRSIGF